MKNHSVTILICEKCYLAAQIICNCKVFQGDIWICPDIKVVDMNLCTIDNSEDNDLAKLHAQNKSIQEIIMFVIIESVQ